MNNIGYEEEELCVNGGTGFIAAHVIKLLLENGYKGIYSNSYKK